MPADGGADLTSNEVLVARDVSKHYGGVRALEAGSLTLRRGEIHGLVGENGAGKSTLVKVLCGIVQGDAGTVHVDGLPVSYGSARDAAGAGIALVAQELSLYPDLSVRENLFPRAAPRRFGLISGRTIDSRARPVLAQFELDVDMRAPVGELALADQQLLEICRALLQEPRVLVLDEPTSAQPRAAVERLDGILRTLARRGLTVLYISHFLEEVIRLCDRVTVLRDGHTVLDGGEIADVSLDRLVTTMVGRAVAPAARRTAPRTTRGGDGVRLRDVSVGRTLRGVSLQVDAGEIVGVAGLQGAGHLDVLGVACGRVRPTSGEVLLPRGARPRSMRHAYARGVAFVPSDRKRFGLMLDKLVWENVTTVSWLALGRAGPWQRTAQFRQSTEELLRRLQVRGSSDTPAGELSGGNQQKIVFAKWLHTRPSVLVLDDPTRGVDIGARAEMHGIVRATADTGTAVLIASTDLAELVELCDRVVVLQHGRVVDELSGEGLTEERLSTAMNAGFVAAR
jgi:ABC-type sugar transport system ATPase subunit